MANRSAPHIFHKWFFKLLNCIFIHSVITVHWYILWLHIVWMSFDHHLSKQHTIPRAIILWSTIFKWISCTYSSFKLCCYIISIVKSFYFIFDLHNNFSFIYNLFFRGDRSMINIYFVKNQQLSLYTHYIIMIWYITCYYKNDFIVKPSIVEK